MGRLFRFVNFTRRHLVAEQAHSLGRLMRLYGTSNGWNLYLDRTSRNLLLLYRIGSLELFLHQETGVEQDAVLAYLSDGRRLTNSNVRELAGSQDQVRCLFSDIGPAKLDSPYMSLTSIILTMTWKTFCGVSAWSHSFSPRLRVFCLSLVYISH